MKLEVQDVEINGFEWQGVVYIEDSPLKVYGDLDVRKRKYTDDGQTVARIGTLFCENHKITMRSVDIDTLNDYIDTKCNFDYTLSPEDDCE